MENSNLSNIGSKVRKERRSKGLSQSDLSKKLGISASYLNLIESGRRTITVPLLIKIGNERVIQARVNDAEFFWKRNKSQSLVKQVSKLKNMNYFKGSGVLSLSSRTFNYTLIRSG